MFVSSSFDNVYVCPPEGRLCTITEQEAFTCNAEKRERRVGGTEEEEEERKQKGGAKLLPLMEDNQVSLFSSLKDSSLQRCLIFSLRYVENKRSPQ